MYCNGTAVRHGNNPTKSMWVDCEHCSGTGYSGDYRLTEEAREKIVEALQSCAIIAEAGVQVFALNQDMQRDAELAKISNNLLKSNNDLIPEAIALLTMEEEKE